ncbi:hypothetical protein EJH27_01525 [Salmonella enterica subsp. enterica serovar Virchow]|nr:hypothetical protein [Salmonella enterica subsp. enterica serovar Virchow]
MRFSDRVVVSALALLTVLVQPHSAGAATNEASAVVTLKVTWVMPPCEVSGPATVQLGSIHPGVRSYPSLDLTVTCPLATVAHLYAVAGNGQSLVNGSVSRVNMTNVAGRPGQPAQFWLKDAGGTEIALDGGGATDVAKRFCTGSTTGNNGSRTCRLTPWTGVFPGVPTGPTTARVTFTVVMP